MTSRHLVDPQLIPLLEQMPPFDITADNLFDVRAAVAQMQDAAGTPVHPGVTMEVLQVPGPVGAPPVRVVLYSPRQVTAPCPALMHIHGGGYVLGTPEMNHGRNAALANDLRCVVLSVDYRLAPETRAPGSVEDCYAALAWLHAHAAPRGIDPTRIAVLGQSAGGGLAAALCLLARDRGEWAIAMQILIYPMLDDRTGRGPAENGFAGEFLWPAPTNQFGWSALLGEAGHAISPYAVPARAERLQGLPPTFIGVGALDLFVEEGLDYSRRLLRAGVPLELHIYEGAFHGFDLATEAEVSQRLNRDYRAALAKVFRQ
jgi:acetyl esterase/lipase